MIHSLRRPWFLLAGGTCLGLFFSAILLGAAWMGGFFQSSAELELPEIVLKATSTHAGDSMIIATGQIDEDIEGLYILDTLTGDLTCWVILPTTGKAGGIFKTNVLGPLAIEKGKKPNLLMVTGGVNFTGATGTTRPANSVVYIADADSGNVAGFYVMWNRAMASSRKAQTGVIVAADGYKARDLAIRGD